ncbi:hypothetical protein Amal_01963 [Acetobacter malorum]|uniref:Uncharacterized protein n=1 Tax=Acetobacter malorum TaxID=178901 RepID=A0A177G7B5_9PROT|nr:hypothetical protein Amal_01963 [Acetobacter malorum]
MKVSGCHTHGNPLVYLNFNPRREEAVMLSKLPARRMQLVIRTSGVLVGTPDVSDIFGDMIMISRRLLAALSTVALMGAAAPSFAQEAAAPAAPAVSAPAAPAAPAAEAPAAPSAESAAPAAPEAAKEEGTKKKGKKKHHHGKHHGKKSKKAASSDASSSDTSAQ